MKRRRFLQLLGIAPVALAVVTHIGPPKPPAAPKPPAKDDSLLTFSNHWQPNTCYQVGDKVIVNGTEYTVVQAGISGSCEPWRKEEFMDKMPSIDTWGTAKVKTT